MNHFPQNLRLSPVVAILLFALVTRLGAFGWVYAHDPARVVFPDTISYENPARALLDAGRFSLAPNEPDVPEVMRTPGYPVLIAISYALFGQNRAVFLILQIILSVAAVALVYDLGRRVISPAAGLAAAGLVAVDPVSFLYSQVMLTETAFTFFLTLAVWFGVILIQQTRPRREAWAALGMGAALMTATFIRPITIYAIWPLLGGLIIIKRLGGGSWKWAGALAALAALPWAIGIGGWSLRNHTHIRRATFTTVGDYNMLANHAALLIALRDGSSHEVERERLLAAMPDPATRPPAELARIYRDAGLEIIRAHPAIYARLMATGAARVLVAPVGRNIRQYFGAEITGTGPVSDLGQLGAGDYVRKWLVRRPLAFILIFYELTFMAALYGGIILLTWKRRWPGEWATAALLGGVIFYLLLLSAGSEATARFRAPLVPLLAVIAAAGYKTILRPTPSAKTAQGSAVSSDKCSKVS